MSGVLVPGFITAPLSDATAWASALQQRDIPVLESTALALEELRTNEDAVDAQMLSSAMVDDPLMTLKLLRFVAAKRSRRAVSDAETALSSVVLLGIAPFFTAFPAQPTVEQRLQARPEALAGLKAVLQRAHRAARFALGFAVHRMDHDAAVIHGAALLHDFAEMLIWAHAPDLALEVDRRLHMDATLRSADAQRTVLRTTLSELQQKLMHLWHLPELLTQISNDSRPNSSPQLRNVLLAVRISRHSALGWENPALPDDLRELAALLNLSLPHVERLLADLEL